MPIEPLTYDSTGNHTEEKTRAMLITGSRMTLDTLVCPLSLSSPAEQIAQKFSFLHL
jgi:hypothetical protein